MSLNLVKLCVGVETVEELESNVAFRLDQARAMGLEPEQKHPTRMVPKRIAELLDGGSLYWVIKGQVQVRQPLLAIRPFTDAEGIRRCHLVMQPVFLRTAWQPRRPFQGWRYLDAKDAPADLAGDGSGGEGLPPELRRELIDLGLL